jgi:hypothetical protein
MEFSFSHHYGSSAEGIEVPVTLGNGGQSVDLIAKLDTGAAHCIFERRYAEILGINPESGRLQRFRTATGSFAAYEHEVDLQVLGIAFSTTVFFAQNPVFTRKFLGRAGWLDRLRLAIVDYDRNLYLSAYDS